MSMLVTNLLVLSLVYLLLLISPWSRNTSSLSCHTQQATVSKSAYSTSQASLYLTTYLCHPVIPSKDQFTGKSRGRRLGCSSIPDNTITGYLLPNFVSFVEILSLIHVSVYVQRSFLPVSVDQESLYCSIHYSLNYIGLWSSFYYDRIIHYCSFVHSYLVTISSRDSDSNLSVFIVLFILDNYYE